MIWFNINYLWLLLIIPLLVAGSWYLFKRTRKVREKYFSASLFQDLYKTHWSLGSTIKNIFMYSGMAFLIVALAGPKIGTQVKEVKQKGIDMIIALDLSLSMDCQDVSPSRLEKAKYEISRLLDRLKGDRVGLIVFTGQAYLQSPLTMDFSALRMFLDVAATDQMPSTTTNFSAAMTAADKAFHDVEQRTPNSKASKVLLIVSDGENQGYDYKPALKSLVKNHIDVYTIGVGTTEGGAIPILDKSGNLKGYKRDENGKVVITKLQPETLQHIAEEGNGAYYQIDQSQGIDGFLRKIDQLQKGEFGEQQYADFKNQYQVLAVIGLGFMFLSILFPKYREKKEA